MGQRVCAQREGAAVGTSGHWGELVPAGGWREEPPAGISPALKSRLHILCSETQPWFLLYKCDCL